MHLVTAAERRDDRRRSILRGVGLALVVVAYATMASAHELWIEAPATATPNEPLAFQTCWGHGGEKVRGAALEGQRAKLTTFVLTPDGKRQVVEPAAGTDGFSALVTPAAAGCYLLGAELQSGILNRERHGIPANTRIIMYGKALTQVGMGTAGRDQLLGSDLELVLLSGPQEPRPGGVVRAKVLFHGKPIGGRKVEVSLSTQGEPPFPEHPQIQTRAWSITASPDPRDGEVTFPLIAAGPHLFLIRYLDETAGTYAGERNDASDFSHLRPGDPFERTMYIATLRVVVAK